MKDYIQKALKTEQKDYQGVADRYTPEVARLMHAATGLCTESGEFLDMLKKHVNYDKALDRVNASEELGDLMWYIAIACDELGLTLDDIMQLNIDKLAKRYGTKYSDDKANNRDLNQERAVLMGKML